MYLEDVIMVMKEDTATTMHHQKVTTVPDMLRVREEVTMTKTITGSDQNQSSDSIDRKSVV